MYVFVYMHVRILVDIYMCVCMYVLRKYCMYVQYVCIYVCKLCIYVSYV